MDQVTESEKLQLLARLEEVQGLIRDLVAVYDRVANDDGPIHCDECCRSTDSNGAFDRRFWHDLAELELALHRVQRGLNLPYARSRAGV